MDTNYDAGNSGVATVRAALTVVACAVGAGVTYALFEEARLNREKRLSSALARAEAEKVRAEAEKVRAAATAATVDQKVDSALAEIRQLASNLREVAQARPRATATLSNEQLRHLAEALFDKATAGA